MELWNIQALTVTSSDSDPRAGPISDFDPAPNPDQVSDGMLEAIGGLPLTSLNLAGCGISDNSLANLGGKNFP